MLGRLNLGEQLGAWRSADELCGVLDFQPRFRLALQWILARLLESGCIQVQDDGATRSYRLRNTPWKPDLKYLRALGLNIDPANAATLDLLDYAASAYPAVATGRQSGDHNLFGPQGIPLWLNYFHNDNPTYAVNNWVGAAAAADRLSSRPTLRVLEIGAGTGSATEILLKLLDERSLLPRLECYVVTEPNAYFRRCNQRKLAAQYPNLPLEWASLDLDLPWSTQGIASGEFDLVYAVNVMHISKNLLFSLNEARSALATGGWLVIGECVRPYDNQPMYPELMFQILDSFTNVRNRSGNSSKPWLSDCRAVASRFFASRLHARGDCAGYRANPRDLPAFFHRRHLRTKHGNRKMISEIVSPKRSEADRWVSVPERGTPAFAGSDRLDRGAGRSAASEAVVISDHNLLSDHGTYGASGVLRIPEAGARRFSSLVERVAPFLLFCRYDSGPRLSVAR